MRNPKRTLFAALLALALVISASCGTKKDPAPNFPSSAFPTGMTTQVYSGATYSFSYPDYWEVDDSDDDDIEVMLLDNTGSLLFSNNMSVAIVNGAAWEIKSFDEDSFKELAEAYEGEMGTPSRASTWTSYMLNGHEGVYMTFYFTVSDVEMTFIQVFVAGSSNAYALTFTAASMTDSDLKTYNAVVSTFSIK